MVTTAMQDYAFTHDDDNEDDGDDDRCICETNDDDENIMANDYDKDDDFDDNKDNFILDQVNRRYQEFDETIQNAFIDLRI